MSCQIEDGTARLVVVVHPECQACKKFMEDYRADLEELDKEGLLVLKGPEEVARVWKYPSFLVERNGDREFIPNIREAEPGELANHVRRKYLSAG